MLPALLSAAGRMIGAKAVGGAAAAQEPAKPQVANDQPETVKRPTIDPKKLGSFGIRFTPSTSKQPSAGLVPANDITTENPIKLLKIVAAMVTKINAGIDRQVRLQLEENRLALDENRSAREQFLEAEPAGSLSGESKIEQSEKQIGLFTAALGGLVAAAVFGWTQLSEESKKVVKEFATGLMDIVEKVKELVGGDGRTTRNTNSVADKVFGTENVDDFYRGLGVDIDSTPVDSSSVKGFKKGQKKEDLQRGVYKAFRNAGFNHEAALTMGGEVGRENGYNASTLFGYHKDPHNRKVNVGMFSWQGDRGSQLERELKKKGLIKDGKLIQSQETLDAMAKFAKTEMLTGSHGGSKTQRANVKEMAERLLGPTAVTNREASRIIGRDYIRWRYDDPKYRSHHQTASNFRREVARAVSEQATVSPVRQAAATAPAKKYQPAKPPVQKRMNSVYDMPKVSAAPAARPTVVVQQAPKRVAAAAPVPVVSPNRTAGSDYGWYFGLRA